MKYLVILLLAACGTTVNMNVPQPNLQSINLGQPNCHMDCHTTQTATQGDGATGATVSNTSGDRTRSTNLGSGQ